MVVLKSIVSAAVDSIRGTRQTRGTIRGVGQENTPVKLAVAAAILLKRASSNHINYTVVVGVPAENKVSRNHQDPGARESPTIAFLQ